MSVVRWKIDTVFNGRIRAVDDEDVFTYDIARKLAAVGLAVIIRDEVSILPDDVVYEGEERVTTQSV